MNTHPDCYGTMLPDFTRLKREEWEKCVSCAEYRTCYDLSLAKLEMNNVLMNTMVADPWAGDCGD